MSDVVEGVFELQKNKWGILRDPTRSFRSSSRDIRVPPHLVRKFGLRNGASVTAVTQRKGPKVEIRGVESIAGMTIEEFRQRRPYRDLTAIAPCERFNLGAMEDPSMRMIDLIAPIAKGTRGLIVSPPKAGKTTILEKIAQSINTLEPESRIIVLLVDERPEEVTAFRRAVNATVLASSNDQTVEEHVALCELTLAHMRTELECGRDIVVLVDSLTRMGRAYNVNSPGTRRTLSGGVDASALNMPRQFFGMARKIEGGGSITIVATVLVDTGSRMDQVIFEEFKGTGNSEIILDRTLAEARIFPALSVSKSGTRRDEELYTPEEFRRIESLRRVLAGRHPREALELLGKFIQKYPTNEEFLRSDFVA